MFEMIHSLMAIVIKDNKYDLQNYLIPHNKMLQLYLDIFYTEWSIWYFKSKGRLILIVVCHLAQRTSPSF